MMRSPVVRVSGAMAALIAGHTVLETARDARFLQQLPASRLAIAYAAMAVLTIVAGPAAARLVERFGRQRALVTTLVVSAVGALAFALAPATPAAAMALHLWTGTAATVLCIQFWLLATELAGATGRRLLAPIAAAGTVGAFAGAGLATLLAAGGVEWLLGLSAACYLVAAVVVRSIPHAVAIPDPAVSARWSPPRRAHLRRLATIVALSTAALLLADYLFKLTVSRSVPTGDLPVFFARYNAVVAALALVVQAGGVGWLIGGRRRLIAALMVLPVLLLIGATIALALPVAIVGVVLAKGADGVLRHSLHRVSLEVLWTPLPARLRARAKPPIDGVLVRITQALTAACLLFLPATPEMLAGLVGAIALLWLIAAVTIRRSVSELMVGY